MLIFFSENCDVYEIMWKKCGGDTVQYDAERTQLICWVNKARMQTQTHCLMLIAFPLQQWLHQRASILHCKYIKCIFSFLTCSDFSFLLTIRRHMKCTFVQRKCFSHTTLDTLVVNRVVTPAVERRQFV